MKKNKYFPFFTNIEGLPVLIIGCNKKALDKTQKLMPFRPSITLAANEFPPGLCIPEGIKTVTARGKEIEALIQKTIPRAVIVADTTIANAEEIYLLCLKNRIEINTVDKKELSSFIFPSLIQRGDLTVAVSTSGASPAASVKIRENIEESLPSSVDEILDWLSLLRPELKKRSDIAPQALPLICRALVNAAFCENKALDSDTTEEIIRKFS